MKVLLVLAVGVCALSATAQTRRATSPRQTLPANGWTVSLNWLPSQSEAQKVVLERLAAKAGVSPTFRIPASAPERNPLLSARELDDWLSERERGTSQSGRGVWMRAAEQLLLARELCQSKSATWHRWGAGLARRTALQVATRDNDLALGAQILEGFALPFINDLPDKAVAATDEADGSALEPNKQMLLQDATNFYRAGGNPQRLLSAVVALVFVAEKAGDTEGADWARIKLAQDLGNRGRFYEAIAQLKAVTSPNLLGARAWIPELELKAKAPQPATETPQP